MRTTPKISITLEGNTWQDILREMTIIQECARRASSAPRIDDLPERANIAKEERSGQDGAEKPVCAYCGSRADTIQSYIGKLSEVLKDYDLGPEERAEILERVRQ